MKKIKNLFNKVFIENKLYIYSFIFILILLNKDTVFATTLGDNQITNGLKELLKDAASLVMVLATLAAPSLIGFFQFKKKFINDEMECKQLNKKTISVIICYILIMCAGVIINIVSGYFKISGVSV